MSSFIFHFTLLDYNVQHCTLHYPNFTVNHFVEQFQQVQGLNKNLEDNFSSLIDASNLVKNTQYFVLTDILAPPLIFVGSHSPLLVKQSKFCYLNEFFTPNGKVFNKNPAYGKQSISRPMLIVAQMP